MFDYRLPSYQNELLPMYPDSNWYISDKTITLIDVMFSSTKNKYRSYYTDSLNKMTPSKRREVKQNMAQAAIRALRYYFDNESYFAKEPKNIHGYLFLLGWKLFIAQAKPLNKPPQYMPTTATMIEHYGELYMDRLSDEIKNPIQTRKKSRPTRRKKKTIGYSKKYLDHLCNID